MPEPTHGTCQSVRLPFEESSVAVARRLLSESLRDANVNAEVLDDAKVVLSELVTNGVTHGTPDENDCIEVGWCIFEDRVRVSVIDSGTTNPVEVSTITDDAVHGRGLAIVEYMCDSWTVHRDSGTRLTAELSLV